MNNVDIFFDILIGSLKDGSVRRRGASSSRTDFSNLHEYNWQQILAINKSIFGSVFFKKYLCKKNGNFGNPSDGDKNDDTDDEPVFKCINKDKMNLWKAKLKNQLKKVCSKNSHEQQSGQQVAIPMQNNSLLEINMIDQFLKQVHEPKKEKKESNEDMATKVLSKANDEDGNHKNLFLDGLELFFQGIIKSIHDFNDEEILDLQMQVLKYVKTVKEKRELKKNLRRYCVATMNFSDSMIHNSP